MGPIQRAQDTPQLSIRPIAATMPVAPPSAKSLFHRELSQKLQQRVEHLPVRRASALQRQPDVSTQLPTDTINEDGRRMAAPEERMHGANQPRSAARAGRPSLCAHGVPRRGRMQLVRIGAGSGSRTIGR